MISLKTWLISAAPALVLLSACADQKPQPLQAMKSPPMQEQDIGGHPTLAYIAPDANFKKYKKFIIDPVAIYQGSDAQFGDATQADKEKLAQFMHSAFVGELSGRYKIVSTPGPDVLRIQLTLAGLEDTVPVAGTISHVLPAGIVMNLVNSESGKPGSFSAGVTIAGEFRDSQSNALLASFVQKRYPDAMDITDTLTSLDGQKAAITETAATFRKRVDKIQAGGKATE